jgi:hypothetical protein
LKFFSGTLADQDIVACVMIPAIVNWLGPESVASARTGIAHPAQVERRDGRIWWRLGGPRRKEKRQRICQLAIVEEMQVLDLIAGALREVVRFDAHPAVRNPYRPEQAAGRDARIHVVDLMSVGRQRVYLTLIDVESDEAEGPFVFLSVDRDVPAAHKSVVAVEQKCRRLARLRIPASAGALDGRDPRRALVVEDRTRLYPWPEEGMVEIWDESTRNRNWVSP